MVRTLLLCMIYFTTLWKADLIVILVAQCFTSFLNRVIYLIIALHVKIVSNLCPALRYLISFLSSKTMWNLHIFVGFLSCTCPLGIYSSLKVSVFSIFFCFSSFVVSANVCSSCYVYLQHLTTLLFYNHRIMEWFWLEGTLKTT